MPPGKLAAAWDTRQLLEYRQAKVYRRVGTVSFEVEGAPVELTVYDTGYPGLFLPFRDATSGGSTYGAGRYLDIGPNDDRTLTIDFNYAYNPSCVYSDGYSCPLPHPKTG